MDILETQSLAIAKMKEHGLHEMGYRFRFNNRTRSAGLCVYSSKRIELGDGVKPSLSEASKIEVKLK